MVVYVEEMPKNRSVIYIVIFTTNLLLLLLLFIILGISLVM